MSTSDGSQSEDWLGDVMRRKPHAGFLTAYIEKRMALPGSTLTIALDADWGAGKTFFVKRWAEDLDKAYRGVLVFDAWKNDTAADPVLGFMAELQLGMQVLRKRVPADLKASAAIKETAVGMYKAVRKAIVPATAMLASGLLKKASGTAAEELIDAIKGEAFEFDLDAESIETVASEQLEKSLDLFFKKALEDHRSRNKATATFRTALERLVAQLQDAKAIEGPLYVFIDEVDRCRPDYAIRLLEGIKHLFSVPGVVFVVSTNLRQLSRSVQAVYGANFDGSTYLQRFFDFESTLPPPDNYGFARLLSEATPIFKARALDYGLDGMMLRDREPDALAFSLIATGFDLPPRAQELVYVTASAAISPMPVGHPVALLWLFFLAALRQTRRELFDRISQEVIDTSRFEELVNAIGKFRHVLVEAPALNSQRTGYETTFHTLAKVLGVYYKASYTDLTTLRQSLNNNNLGYPQVLLVEHVRRSEQPAAKSRSVLFDYFRLVNSAGLLG